MRIFILTDIPVWVRPLAGALTRRGAEVTVAADPEEVAEPDIVVNRLSTRVVRRFPDQVSVFIGALENWRNRGVPVINGADCLRLGFSKIGQDQLFKACGVKTPRTASVRAGKRAFPGIPVLIKPPAGGFGKGIHTIGPDESIPMSLFDGNEDWIEQERIEPADGVVHRVEILGTRILYDAATPVLDGEFNYCLANADAETTLVAEDKVPETIREPVLRIARAAGMELGAVEYLLDRTGVPMFIDLNPVSSLHPQAESVLGYDPISATADFMASSVPGKV